MKCEKCGNENGVYVKEYEGYLCEFHAQCWLIKNEENRKNGLLDWVKNAMLQGD